MLFKQRNLFHFIALCTIFSSMQACMEPDEEYIRKWKAFYPSKALELGIHASVLNHETLDPASVETWLAYNKTILTTLSDKKNAWAQAHPIDARLLLIQAREELETWQHEQAHRKSILLYTRHISNALKDWNEISWLLNSEKASLVCDRLLAVQVLCQNAIKNLKGIRKNEIENAKRQLTQNLDLFSNPNSWIYHSEVFRSNCKDLDARIKATAEALQELFNHLDTKLAPKAEEGKLVLGKEEYSRKLALYTDMDLRPDELSEMALKEIEDVRELIGIKSLEYVSQQYPDQNGSISTEEAIRLAFADMEKDAPTGAEDYLTFWQQLSEQAIKFIRENQIATLPEYQSLRIVTAPESAGAAARIGWVDSAAAFDPNPLTTLYLPSIPDTLPKQEQIDFWASFNKPFNRMIVIHELFPGHYMQIKISRENAHIIRLFFPYHLYFEGWATFTERVLLDAGWEKDRPLTFLAHLRKRLENANRAYTSVQVHCNEWDQEKVMKFSIERSLLAPQFAKSLWGRIMQSPMQLCSYFLGGRQFTELLERERKRLGSRFIMKDFMDTAMRTGAIPIDSFYRILEKENP